MKQTLRSEEIYNHCRKYYKKYADSITLKDITLSLQSMPYRYKYNNYFFNRSTVGRAVKGKVSKSVGVSQHRFTSCRRQELNQIKTVLMVIRRLFRSCMRDNNFIGCFS